ncbi:MAG TPA: DUF4870 domain-containing protein [Rudaea sp.]|nr:DUF4870 domain-containing protein [Rudaea sp.]
MSVPPNDVSHPTPPPPGAPSAEEKQWALFAHLSALLGAIVTGWWFGFGCFIGPLIIWLVKKDTMPFVNDQGREAVNFNITLAIISAILLVLTIMTFGLGILIAIPVGLIVGIAWLIFTIIAAIKASEGVAYRYPISLRLIK